MSRSYKKIPWSGDKKGKSKKRVANHKVRSWLKQHPDEPLNRNSYKKVYETWDICDYGWFCTWEEYWKSAIHAWEQWEKDRGKPFPDKKEEYRRWIRYYKTK